MRLPLLAPTIATLAMALAPCAASAQDIVMRRPLPKGVPTVPGTPDAQPTGTPAGETTPTLTPATQGPIGTPNTVDDPAKTICDANSGEPVLTDVQWIDAGWSTPRDEGAGCTAQTQQYTCQATYTCTISGRQDTFVSEAPDSTCKNFTGDVKYAQGSYPNGNDDQMGAWIAREMRAMGAANPRPAGADPQNRTANRSAGLLSTGMFSSVIAGRNNWILDRGGNSYGYDWVVVALIRYEDPMRGRICAAMAKQGFPCANYGMPSDYIHIKP